MHIGINAIDLIPGKIGGMETYLRNLLFNLREVDAGNTYTILANPACYEVLAALDLPFDIKVFNYQYPSLRWLARGVLRRLTPIDLLEFDFRKSGVDLIHHPFTVLNPPNTKIPAVLTFHDNQQEFYPQFFSKAQLRWRKANYQPSIERAKRVIAISHHCKKCIVDFYNVDPEKVEVIYFGCGAEYRVMGQGEKLAAVKSKYGLDKPFMFYPAATWPHKNHKKLLAALRLLKEREKFDGLLVLTGIAKQNHAEVLKEVAALGLEDLVKILGYVPYDEPPYLYNLARMLVFPSLFEGLGIPLIEAMACGCPVACSNVTSIPEVIGDAGVTFDPESIEDMAAKISLLWYDEGLRRRLITEGLERVKLFDWRQMAVKTLGVYEKVFSL